MPLSSITFRGQENKKIWTCLKIRSRFQHQLLKLCIDVYVLSSSQSTPESGTQTACTCRARGPYPTIYHSALSLRLMANGKGTMQPKTLCSQHFRLNAPDPKANICCRFAYSFMCCCGFSSFLFYAEATSSVDVLSEVPHLVHFLSFANVTYITVSVDKSIFNASNNTQTFPL